MAVTLEQVLISSVKLTTDTVLPIIKVVVTGTEFNDEQNYREIVYGIYNAVSVKRSQIIAAFGFNSYIHSTWTIPETEDLTTGDHVQGDDTGLKLTYAVQRQSYGTNPKFVTYTGLSLKGTNICRCSFFGGYSDFEVVFPFTFVDANNQVLIPNGSYNQIYVKCSETSDTVINVTDLVVTASVPGGKELYFSSNSPTRLTPMGEYLTPYITKELDPQDSDPYAPGGPSEPGGGGGTFDDTSDSNPIPSDPTISATDTGFMTAFATNLAGIQSLAASLWSDIFSAIQPGGQLEETVEALKNIVASPYDAILGCHIIPVAVAVGTSKNVKLYGVLPSSVSLPVAASQWVHKDCGTLTIEPYDGSYLDYAPYSKVTSLYLPFVGVVSVDIDIIMNTTIGVYYKIDIISGQCIAFITKNGDVYFQYQGQCAVPLPVTSVDWSTTVSAGLGIVGSIGSIAGSAVGGALGGGGAAGALAGAVKGTVGEAGSIAQNVMNSKPDIKSGSGIGGSAALMGCKNPYLIIERPRKSTPKIGKYSQNHWTGYPSNIAAKLGDLEGYTEVSRVFVNRTNATAAEKQEIEKLLNEGVYL